jgi:hypothetical protein
LNYRPSIEVCLDEVTAGMTESVFPFIPEQTGFVQKIQGKIPAADIARMWHAAGLAGEASPNGVKGNWDKLEHSISSFLIDSYWKGATSESS